MLASLRNGLGVGLMADFVARSDPELVLCFEPGIDFEYEIWLLTHERLRNDPHVRAVLDFLDRHLRSERLAVRIIGPPAARRLGASTAAEVEECATSGRCGDPTNCRTRIEQHACSADARFPHARERT